MDNEKIETEKKFMRWRRRRWKKENKPRGEINRLYFAACA
jgi:hypothetical protein